MAITAKPTPDELILYELLKHPVLGPEFIHNIDLDPRYDRPFEFSWYQREIMSDFNPKVSMCTARAVGKTVSQYSLLLWALVFKLFPDDYILYTVPSKVHLEPVFTNLVRMFKTNSFLRNFIDSKSGVNSSEFKITLKNGAVLLCRIAGQSGTGSNLIGLHTPWIEVDEAGYFPHSAFQEMQPSLNVWTPGYREIVSGVPTGLRENNVLYQVDRELDTYTKHRISAFDNPRLTEEDIERAKEQYGGDDTEDYTHYVLGQHGRPVFALFDRNLMKIETYPVYQLNIDGIKEEAKENDYTEIFSKINALPMIKDNNYGILLGIDLGYTEPTAIIVMYLDERERIKFHCRIRLTKVAYRIQEKIIDLLDSKFNPNLIGIDRGNAGITLVQNMHDDVNYLHKNYKERMYPIDFSAWVVVGTDADGQENKVKSKPFFVSVLQEKANNHHIIFSSTDQELITELERMTYSKSEKGDITYKTLTERGGKRGEDHFTSALICGIGAYHMTTEFVQVQPKIKLLRAMWI